MSSVAESPDAGLARTFVESRLKSDVSLVGPQLLLAEFPLVLLRHLGSEARPGVLGMLLSL